MESVGEDSVVVVRVVEMKPVDFVMLEEVGDGGCVEILEGVGDGGCVGMLEEVGDSGSVWWVED